MKFFRYPFYKRIVKRERKTRFNNLDERDKKKTIINSLIVILLFIYFFISLISLSILTEYLSSLIQNLILKTLVKIGMIIVTLVVPFFIPCLIGHFMKLEPAPIGELTLKNIQKITEPLRLYYKNCGPYIITKCYKCTNELFSKKDVIIFLYNNRIRITLDFYHKIKDLGCYEFKPDEIDISYVKEGNIVKAFLKSEKIEFLLGKRAKPFIRKCFEKSKCPCCGYYTFISANRGMFGICPVCFWEDDLEQEKDPNYDGGANKVSLIEARNNYLKFGACEKEMIKYCRLPMEEEKKKL